MGNEGHCGRNAESDVDEPDLLVDLASLALLPRCLPVRSRSSFLRSFGHPPHLVTETTNKIFPA
jgi:hypothetical protein